ncbi:hypothetical protein QBC98_003412 [Kitasatospora acidiphila]
MTTPGEQPAFAAGGVPAWPWAAPGWVVAPPAPKPGTVPLRPLDLGDIVSGVLATVRRYPGSLYYPLLVVALGCAGLFSGCAGLAYAEVGPLPASHRMTDHQLVGLTVASAVLVVLFMLLAVIASAITSAVGTVVVGHAVLGHPLTARQAWSRARGHVWRVVGVQLLAAIAALGILVGSLLPSVLLYFVASPIAAAYGLLLLVPGLGGAVYVGVRLVLAVPVLVLEEQRPVAALRRAWQLNRGAWWRSLGIPYLVRMIGDLAVRVAMTVLAMAVSRLLASDSLDGAQAGLSIWLSEAGFTLLVLVVCLAVALLMAVRAPLAPLSYGLLYLDRRLRLEDLGPTLAAAAGTGRTLGHGW